MLWATHKKISKEVLRRLGKYLPLEVYQSFMNGVVYPDKLQNPPHHYGKSEEIKNHLITSRGYFLRDDLQNAYFHLGVALHYIQDSYTSVESYQNDYRGRIIHQNWERYIDESRVVDDDELEKMITNSLRDNDFQRDRCLRIANSLSKGAEGRDSTLYVATLSGQWKSTSSAKPIVDFNLGRRASYVVAESVLSSKNCPTLENSLRDGLSSFENLMRTTEVNLSNKIIRLVNERIELEKKKVPPTGIVSKIKNWIMGIRIELKERSANSNYNYYNNKGHLEKVIREYIDAANRTVTPYSGWYSYQIPKINPNLVNKELLTVKEAANSLGISVQTLKESFRSFNVSCYKIKELKLVRRTEVDNFLSQYPVNSFAKYPD